MTLVVSGENELVIGNVPQSAGGLTPDLLEEPVGDLSPVSASTRRYSSDEEPAFTTRTQVRRSPIPGPGSR